MSVIVLTTIVFLFYDVYKQDMLPAMYLSCIEIMSKWEEMVSTEGQCELDVWPDLGTLTADVISRTAFGSSYAEGRQIFQLQKEQAELLMQAAQTLYLPGMRFLFLSLFCFFIK